MYEIMLEYYPIPSGMLQDIYLASQMYVEDLAVLDSSFLSTLISPSYWYTALECAQKKYTFCTIKKNRCYIFSPKNMFLDYYTKFLNISKRKNTKFETL
mgnify:CR=1 FL=1